MNNDIAAQCEQSFYEELYHYADGKRCLVRDKVSEHIYMRKTLDVYRTEVFQYLRDHPSPHIPRIQAFWQDGSRLVVIEELISGVGLDYALENAKQDRPQRLDMVRQLCDGLSFLHGAHPQIIHRDLKPSNVMITDDGIVKIIDYDAAKPLDDAQDHDTVLIGTRGSAAPEQYGFGKCDARTDVYGLGGIIREMFPDDPQMQQIAGKATQIDPAARYQTVQELRADLPDERRYSGPANGRTTVDALDRSQSEQSEPRELALHHLWPIPGFRTRKIWKMIVAVLVYLMIAGEVMTCTPSNPSAANPLLDTWIFRFTVLGAMLSVVDVVTDWTGLFSRFPLMRNQNPAARIAGSCLAAFVATVCWGLIYAALAIILGLT